MSRLRWAVVGAGWVARDHMVPALRASERSEVTLVVDRDLAAAGRLAAMLPGAAAAGDVSALAGAGLDAVYVATPNDAHLPVVAAAAAAGLPVLCEKPLAAELSDAERMVELVEAAGVLAATAYDQRWHPAHREVTRLVADGALGTVTAVRIVYGCWLPPEWLPPGDTSGDNWRADPVRAGGGAYLDLAPHGLDLVGALLGEDVSTARTFLQRRVHDYSVDDGAVLVGSTASGVLVSLHVSYNTRDVLPRRRLEVVGTAGQLTAVDTMGQTAGGALTFADGGDGEQREIAFDVTLDPFTAQAAAFEDALLGSASWPFPISRDLALLRLLHDAVDVPSTSSVPSARPEVHA
ncbi:putative dehydrogenase [Motilibacter rhizosphaerae]|uniref:Putative dehydrogenase n=1 Tax=Motilibacter rhizosphaerae TaxID=598652 RepID=A0A4Q7NV94_9ACTN|nr:Gfo/Idh/MocA family oxidoreductase [Motilibacter rhizosphaerae]RZS90788.1 putative dehydrogenase [Motilibacter rhizosphaerae]